VTAADTVTPHTGAVWMIELQSRRVLQLASGGTQGQTVVATADGRVLVAQTGHVDEIALARAPKVTAVSVPDGALLPLPVGQIAIQFDQDMWTDGGSGSVLEAQNYTLTPLNAGGALPIVPHGLRWDAAHRTVYLEVAGLEAGQYRLGIGANLRSASEVRIDRGYDSTFTAVLDMSSRVQLTFANTRGDRANGTVSYDVDLTNIGTDDLNGPLVLLLDPGRYFGGSIAGAQSGSGDQSDLWLLDLSAALAARGGKLAAGASLTGQTVTVLPASRFGGAAGGGSLARATLGHGVYAAPQVNLPPTLAIAGTTGSAQSDTFAAATAGQAWTGYLDAVDGDGTLFYWQLVQAPAGMTLTPPAGHTAGEGGYHSLATLNWTPSARDLADTEVVVRVQDSRGGMVLRRFHLPVNGGNHAPVAGAVQNVTLLEGATLSLPLTATDADGDRLTVTVRNLPAGASFDAASGLLTWTPGYD
ncbi:putative Ig domain-containing protein, partial [Chitinimonas koreensis]